jgi:hypothetical protein
MTHEPRMTGGKTCKGPCGQTLPVIMFAVDRSRSDGLNHMCRECFRLTQKRHTRIVRGEKRKHSVRELSIYFDSDPYNG